MSLINEDEQTVSSWEHSMQPQVLPTPLGGQQGCSPCYRHHSNEREGKTHTARCSKGEELIWANPKVDPNFAGQIPSLPMLSLSLESPTKTNYSLLCAVGLSKENYQRSLVRSTLVIKTSCLGTFGDRCWS